MPRNYLIRFADRTWLVDRDSAFGKRPLGPNQLVDEVEPDGGGAAGALGAVAGAAAGVLEGLSLDLESELDSVAGESFFDSVVDSAAGAEFFPA
jgi:hypothetical protein